MAAIDLTESHFPIRDHEVVRETTAGGLLRETAATHPDLTALVEIGMTGEWGREWTYRALLADAEALALGLSTRFSPGERVCLWAPNAPEWVLLEYACALAGLTLVTANPGYQEKELRYVLDQSSSVGLFLTRTHRGNPMWEIAARATGRLVAIREVTDIEDPTALLARGSRHEGLPDVHAGDAVQIQYTSGTTGFPKGVVLSHRGITNSARFMVQRLRAKPGDPMSVSVPLFHTSGCVGGILGAVQVPGTVHLFRVFDPAIYLKTAERARFFMIGGVPTMMSSMLGVLEAEPHDIASVETCACGGSQVPASLVHAVRDKIGCGVQKFYGQTECSPMIAMHERDEALEDIVSTVGRPVPRIEVAIRDPQTSAIRPLGEIGEICVRGYCTMIEYNDNPEATAATVDPEGWLRTGDLGTMDARGYISVTGRVKEMIIRGGENLFPAEIEAALQDHPDVGEIAVVGLPDDHWGEIVAAFIRPKVGASLNPAALKAHCRRNLAAIKSPAIWVEIDQFPLTASGKIRKVELRDRFVNGELTPIGAS